MLLESAWPAGARWPAAGVAGDVKNKAWLSMASIYPPGLAVSAGQLSPLQ